MVIIRQDWGSGTRRWRIVVDGFVLIQGLTKGEAKKLQGLLATLGGIVAQIVARERKRILEEIQRCLDGLSDSASDRRKAANQRLQPAAAAAIMSRRG